MEENNDIADLARSLVRSIDAGVLSTHSKEHEGPQRGLPSRQIRMENQWPSGGSRVVRARQVRHTGASVVRVDVSEQLTHRVLPLLGKRLVAEQEQPVRSPQLPEVLSAQIEVGLLEVDS